MTTNAERKTLPRRANTIRSLSMDIARQSALRQAISDRLGYLLAFVFGAAVFRGAGWVGVGIASAVYTLSIYASYRRYQALKRHV